MFSKYSMEKLLVNNLSILQSDIKPFINWKKLFKNKHLKDKTDSKNNLILNHKKFLTEKLNLTEQSNGFGKNNWEISCKSSFFKKSIRKCRKLMSMNLIKWNKTSKIQLSTLFNKLINKLIFLMRKIKGNKKKWNFWTDRKVSNFC